MKPGLLLDATHEGSRALECGLSTEGASPSLLGLLMLDVCRRILDVSHGMSHTERLWELPLARFEWVVSVLRNHVLGASALIMLCAVRRLGQSKASLSAHGFCTESGESIALCSAIAILCSRRSNQTSCVASSAVGRSSALLLRSVKMKFLHSSVTYKLMGHAEKSTLPSKVLSYVSASVTPLNGVRRESAK